MRDLPRQRGQGLTEYAIILALVLIAIIGIAVTFGDDIRQVFDNSRSAAPATTNAPKPEKAPPEKAPPEKAPPEKAPPEKAAPETDKKQ